jgi:hypothetical protein
MKMGLYFIKNESFHKISQKMRKKPEIFIYINIDLL